MAIVPKKDSFLELFKQRQERLNASNKIAELTLRDLKTPGLAKEKINGDAQYAPSFTSHPGRDVQLELEQMTGHGEDDPFETNEGKKALQLRRRLREKAQRFRAYFDAEDCTVAETAVFRALCCYRMIREFGRLTNRLTSEDLLSDAETLWTRQPRKTPADEKYVKYVINSTQEPFHRARKQSLSTLIGAIVGQEDGLGYTLIPEPRRVADGNELEQGIFVDVFREIAEALYLLRGSSLMPDYGIYGLQGLFDAETIGFVWPSRHELFTLEELLLDELTRKFTESGEWRAHAWLHSKYGFLKHEAMELMHLAFRRTKDYVMNDPEIIRAKTMMRLEHVYQQAGESMDVRAQLQAMKLMAAITGLTQDTGGDSTDDFIRAMARIAEEQDGGSDAEYLIEAGDSECQTK